MMIVFLSVMLIETVKWMQGYS